MSHALPEGFATAVRTAIADHVLSADVVSTEPADLAEYGRDWTRDFAPAPAAIAFPRSTEEVVQLVKLCSAHNVAIVPSGGRTGLAGGAMATRGELVVSMARMRRMDPVDSLGMTVRVQAGAITQAVHEHAADAGLTWPIDLAAKGSSTIGGNIATNAGGVKVIRYGNTRQWVLGLQVVVASGEVLELGGALEKDATGTDLRQLFVGSEGTLGLVTEATLKLTTLPKHLDVLLFAVRDFDQVLEVFRSLRFSGITISAYEFFTDKCMARLARHRKITEPFAESAPFYVLAEVEGADPEDLMEWTEEVLDSAGVLDGTLAQSLSQAQALWELREGISESLSATGLPHKNDISLPLDQLAPFYGRLQTVFADRYPGWEICLFGHVGDGNIHVNTMKPDDVDQATFLAKAHEADRMMFEIVAEHGGSISAEHGIGLLKKDFLSYSRGPGEIAMLRGLKQAIDPHNIFNPGKILDV